MCVLQWNNVEQFRNLHWHLKGQVTNAYMHNRVDALEECKNRRQGCK